MAFDGYTLNLPDEAGNRDTFGFPVSDEDIYTNGSWRSVIRGQRPEPEEEPGRPAGAYDHLPAGAGGAVHTLVTTLMVTDTTPVAELTTLYHGQWEIETACGGIETHLQGPGILLRSRTPEPVFQVLGDLLLAHYAVRSLVHKAVVQASEGLDR